MEGEIVEGEGAVLVVTVGHPIVTNGILCVRGERQVSMKSAYTLLCDRERRANNKN